MVFKKNFLLEQDLPYECIYDQIIDKTRWSIIHECVFEFENKFYLTTYSEGATEMQYETPWEYEDEIECVEVELREVLIKRWMPVIKQNNNMEE